MDPNTELAFSRTHLANERTYAAWLRTGLSVAAAGYAVARLVPVPRGERRFALAAGVALVLIGAALVLIGAWSYHRVYHRLCTAGAPRTPLVRGGVYLLSAAVAVLLLAALAFV